MLQLFKKRNFSALINDTFLFFKISGKSYLKHYIIINGGFLLALTGLIYLVGHVFFEMLFSGFGSPAANAFIEDYFASNLILFIGAGVGILLLVLLLTLLSFCYPVVYLKLYEKNPDPSVKKIVSGIKAVAGKAVIFFLLSLITYVPMILLLSLLSLLLVIILIGIPGFLIIASGMTCWVSFSFYDYINNDTGYFESMQNGFKMLFSNFWTHIGVATIFHVVMNTILGIIAFIPYLIGIFSIVSNPDNLNGNNADPERFTFAGFMMILALILSVLLNYIFSNLLIVNQGLMYYSAIEDSENRSLASEIDLIGTDSE